MVETPMAVKVMVAKMAVLVVHVVVTTVVVDHHVSHVTAKVAKVDKAKVVKAMKMDRKVADHHARDATTANQKPAEVTR